MVNLISGPDKTSIVEKSVPKTDITAVTWEMFAQKAREESEIIIYRGGETYYLENKGQAPKDVEQIFDNTIEIITGYLILTKDKEASEQLAKETNPSKIGRIKAAKDLYGKLIKAAHCPRREDPRSSFRAALAHKLPAEAGGRLFYIDEKGRMHLTLTLTQPPAAIEPQPVIPEVRDPIPFIASDELLLDLYENCSLPFGSDLPTAISYQRIIDPDSGEHIGYSKFTHGFHTFYSLDMEPVVHGNPGHADGDGYIINLSIGTNGGYTQVGELEGLVWVDQEGSPVAYLEDDPNFMYYDAENDRMIEFSQDLYKDLFYNAEYEAMREECLGTCIDPTGRESICSPHLIENGSHIQIEEYYKKEEGFETEPEPGDIEGEYEENYYEE